MIFSIWGEDKSCKSTLALTFPKPLVVMELDIGGFARAIYRFQDQFDSGLIRYEAYPFPFQIGKLDPETLTVRQSKIVVGMKELFYKFTASFFKHLEDDTKTIVIDTGTLLYDLVCSGYLQEKQEIQFDAIGNLLPNERLRVSLTPLEYREPYLRMRGFVYQAKARNKHLVITHHATDEYGPVLQKDGSVAEARTGKRTRHGWQQLGDSADVMVHTFWDNKTSKPLCTIELAEIKQLEGMVFEEPTYDKINEVIVGLRKMWTATGNNNANAKS